MSRDNGGTRGQIRSSALWGTGNRGGDSRANALWSKGGRGFVAILTVLFVTAIPLAGAGKTHKTAPNLQPSYVDPVLDLVPRRVAVLVAALVYILLAALTGSAIVAAVGAILVLLAGIPSGFGFGSRFGGRSSARW